MLNLIKRDSLLFTCSWRQTAFKRNKIFHAEHKFNSFTSFIRFSTARMKYEYFYGSSHSGARKHVILFPGILFSHPHEEENVSLPALLNVYEIMNFNLTVISTDSPTPQHKKQSWKERIPEGCFHRPGTLLGRFGGTPPQPANRIPRADDDDDEFLFLALFIHFWALCVLCCMCVLKRMFFPPKGIRLTAWNFRFICSTRRHFSCHHHRAQTSVSSVWFNF